MTVHWDTSKCENWGKLWGYTSATELAMAMFGYKISESTRVTITQENYKEIAKHIFEKNPYTNFKTGESASLRQHMFITRNAIGFVRHYQG